jgi:excisionase family DNA binding protein
MARKIEGPELLTSTEVGALFRVDARTVNRWARDGKLRYVRTLAGTGYGHLRFYRDEVEALLRGEKPNDHHR